MDRISALAASADGGGRCYAGAMPGDITASRTLTDPIVLVDAIHPHWAGKLALSAVDDRVFHVETGNAGRFTRHEQSLTIAWDGYPRENFVLLGELWCHAGMACGIAHGGRDHVVALRPGTSDLYVLQQIFRDSEYASTDLPASARTIVDLGANIGLAAWFFALRYPEARILAVEPDAGNFALLAANIATVADRVTPLLAAAWPHDGHINLHSEDADGTPLGAWGIQVSERLAGADGSVPCYNVGTLLDRAGFDRVDILKVDIEGAELEVFAQESARWLPRVDLITIETHDRFRPGSDAAVRDALAPLFEELPPRGENLFFRAKRAP